MHLCMLLADVGHAQLADISWLGKISPTFSFITIGYLYSSKFNEHYNTMYQEFLWNK